jgi:hypothetical protein
MTTSTETRADLVRALGVFAEPPGPQHRHLADLLGLPAPTGSDWTEAFVVQLVPHASVYLGAEGMLGGDAAERVAGFWRALRLRVPADPDHVTALLGLYATLLDAEMTQAAGPRRVLVGHARAALLHEHLVSWLLPYTRAMRDVAPPPYAGWAALLRKTLADEVGAVGVPTRLPAHLRHTPPAPALPDDGLDAVLDLLLCPARSGVVLPRAQLGALARGAGLGLRVGDRRRMLLALLEQDPTTVAGLLADRAAGWAVRHRADTPVAGPIARHWAERATATADLLRAATRGGAPTVRTRQPREP